MSKPIHTTRCFFRAAHRGDHPRCPGRLHSLLFQVSLLVVLAAGCYLDAADPLAYADPQPHRYLHVVRASSVDPQAAEHPEIDFLFEKEGVIQDRQHGIVDTRVKPRGKLVIWLMGHNEQLFNQLAHYGLHAIQVHYANRWFSKICREQPVGAMCRGDARLEAATGEDYSDQLDIPKPDGMVERARQLVLWLSREAPQARWDYFLTKDGQHLRWEDVILSGISHGSTTAARFAVHQKVSRVVMFSGPRDQHQTWQKLPSATPGNRFFGFTHVLDRGWTADHYCRSWELLGLHHYGPVTDVAKQAPPYVHTRRLITQFDVKGNSNRAHVAVVPGAAALRTNSGGYAHEPVWEYLFTHPCSQTGPPVPQDTKCKKNQRSTE